MKKVALLALICVLVISLTGCTDRYYYSDSLEHYVEKVMRSKVGNSSFGIDRPSIFLPSQRFLLDFEYTSCIYRWYENDPGNFHAIYTTTSLLVLRYDEDVYWSAKEHMIANINQLKNCNAQKEFVKKILLYLTCFHLFSICKSLMICNFIRKIIINQAKV